MRSVFVVCFLGIVMHFFSFVRGGEDERQPEAARPGKFYDAENDPILQALGALRDERLRDQITEAVVACYSSQFGDAHERIAAIMEKYPESAIGDVLYDFLLLMDGTALGFSGECGQAIETLSQLQSRIENAGDDARTDDMIGVISLKIDILADNGNTAAALKEMDTLIARFGGCDLPGIRWRVRYTLQRKAFLHEQGGEREQAIAAYRAYAESLQSAGELDDAERRSLDAALRKLEELE